MPAFYLPTGVRSVAGRRLAARVAVVMVTATRLPNHRDVPTFFAVAVRRSSGNSPQGVSRSCSRRAGAVQRCRGSFAHKAQGKLREPGCNRYNQQTQQTKGLLLNCRLPGRFTNVTLSSVKYGRSCHVAAAAAVGVVAVRR